MTIVDDVHASDTASAEWTEVCLLSDLEPLWGEAALVGGQQVAVVRMPDDGVLAVSHRDPETGAYVMARGIIGSKGGRATIASPLHKDVFDLETGACLTKPELRLPVWRARVLDGRVEVAERHALVAASHGTSDPAGHRAVAALVDAVRTRRPDLLVADAHVDVEQPDVPAALGGLAGGRAAVVVPLLLSAGYHVHVDLAELAAEAAPRDVRVTPALGPDRRLALILARRLVEAGLGPDDTVILVAAGSTNESAVEDCRIVGSYLAEELGRDVPVSFLSAAEPRLADAVASSRASSPEKRIIIATYLLAPGFFAGLATRAGADVVSLPLLADGELPPPELVDIVVELFESAASGAPS